MAVKLAGRARKRSCTERDEQVEQDPSNSKRRRGAESGEKFEPSRQSPRLRRRSVESKPRPTRESPRLRERRDLNQQPAVRPASSSPRTVETRYSSKQKRTGPTSKGPPGRKYFRLRSTEDEQQPKPILTNPGVRKNLKRRRNIKDGDLSNPNAKRSKRNNAEESETRVNRSKSRFIEAWLDTSCSSRRSSTGNEKPFGEVDLVVAEDMPLPTPDGSGASDVLTSSNKSNKSSASVHDTDYRKSLSYRNIYINRKDPPIELMRKAKEIITGLRSSPEADEAAAKEVKKTSRELETKNEEDIIQQLAPSVIPGMDGVLDPRLASSANQQWTDFVPVPLDPSVITSPLPLPKPKPDKTFGYAEKAFSRNQLATIDLLTDQLGRNYAIPDKGLLFPFLDDEFKSQGKGGSHVIATNQAAGAGAVAMHGCVELARRGSGLDTLDYDEPQFFSLSMDHSIVHVYVHWLSVDAEDGQFNFHTEWLSLHSLRDLDGLRAVHRTMKNILDWALRERLPAICKLLDTYRAKLRKEKAEAEAKKAAEKAERPVLASEGALAETEPRNGQKQKGQKRKNSIATVAAPNDKPTTKRDVQKPKGRTNQGNAVGITVPSIEDEEPRRAPPPPRPLQSARALYDFSPPSEKKLELGFKEGEMIEFVNAEADENGWLRGRIKGRDGRWGLVPAEYLELKTVGQTEAQGP